MAKRLGKRNRATKDNTNSIFYKYKMYNFGKIAAMTKIVHDAKMSKIAAMTAIFCKQNRLIYI